MTTEKLSVGDDVTTYDNNEYRKGIMNGKVTDVGDKTFTVKWNDLDEETEYQWSKVSIENGMIYETVVGVDKTKRTAEDFFTFSEYASSSVNYDDIIVKMNTFAKYYADNRKEFQKQELIKQYIAVDEIPAPYLQGIENLVDHILNEK